MVDPVLTISGLVDLLGRAAPDELARLRREYPEHASFLEPGRVLGTGELAKSDEGLLLDLLTRSLEFARAESAEALRALLRRLRVTMRLRIGGNLVSSISTAGLIAAVVSSQKTATIVSAAVAFVASSLSLVAQYIEEFAGGQNALRDLRERLSRHTVELSEAEGELRLITIAKNTGDLIPLVRKVNTAVASIRQIQVLIGA